MLLLQHLLVKLTIINREETTTKVYKVITTPYGSTEELVDTVKETYDTTENKPEFIVYNGKKYQLTRKGNETEEKGTIPTGETEVVYVYKLVEEVVEIPTDEPKVITEPPREDKEEQKVKETPKHSIPKTNVL